MLSASARRRALLAVLVLAVAVAAWPAYWLWFGDGTVYSQGYSEGRFRLIKRGMRESDVRRELGKPFSTYSCGDESCWEYARWDPDAGNRYKVRVVVFDKHGRVVRKVAESHEHND